MNIAICDDHQETTRAICLLIKDYFAKHDLTFNTLSTYTDGDTLLKNFEKHKNFDIIFLDVEMPSISGIDVAKSIRQSDSEALIIFVSNYPHFMSASFKVEAFDFLPKPVAYADIDAVLTRCLRKYRQRYGQLTVKTSLGMAVIFLNNILYIVSNKHYIDFISKDGCEVRSSMTLNQVEEQLHSFRQFARCHQSYIANLDYVTEVQRNRLIIQEKFQHIISTVPISRRYTSIIKNRFFRYYLK